MTDHRREEYVLVHSHVRYQDKFNIRCKCTPIIPQSVSRINVVSSGISVLSISEFLVDDRLSNRQKSILIMYRFVYTTLGY